MFRKLALVLAASAALGAAALSPTAASAHGWGHHGWGHGHGHGFGFGFSPVIVTGGYADDDGCLVQRRVRTPYGVRYRTVNVCY
ncbi:hypothetical protein BH10PSE11_BH10PSE11_05530 [soil metagenome]